MEDEIDRVLREDYMKAESECESLEVEDKKLLDMTHESRS